MTPPPFKPGDTGKVGELHWRISRGNKAEGDMVLDVKAADWTRVKLCVACLFADFHYQVEDILYPTRRGGEYPLSAIAEACRENGWRHVADRIERERNGGQRPTFTRHQPLAPYAGREDEGAAVGRLRTAVTFALWSHEDRDSIAEAILYALRG